MKRFTALLFAGAMALGVVCASPQYNQVQSSDKELSYSSECVFNEFQGNLYIERIQRGDELVGERIYPSSMGSGSGILGLLADENVPADLGLCDSEERFREKADCVGSFPDWIPTKFKLENRR